MDFLRHNWDVIAAIAGAVTAFASRRRIWARIAGSWVGRRLAIEASDATCREELRDLRDSIERREAGWADERADLDRRIAFLGTQVATLTESLERLSALGAAIKTAHDAGSLTASAPPSSTPTPSPANSPPSSPRSKP